MGVPRLAALLESRRRIYRDVRFRNSRLLVDGCNLIHLLYHGQGLDGIHGGEYAAFEDVIERFISALRACGIAPFVVLDGGSDPNDRKLQTVTQRAEDRIRRAHLAAVGGVGGAVLPQMSSLVFRQALSRLGVPMAQCCGEADHEIAALACRWHCPVLSNDSDFFIFNLPAGVLPISHFHWEQVQRSGSSSFIPCKSYRTSSFCIFFGIQQEILPAFAVLAGNDKVNLQKMELDISWDQYAPSHSEVGGRTKRLEGLLCWLTGFQQPQEAIEAALRILGNQDPRIVGNFDPRRRNKLLQELCAAMEDYEIPSSSLEMFFTDGTAPPLPGLVVPGWMGRPLAEASFSPDFLDVLLLQRMNLGFPVDSGLNPSAHLVSRPLRQVMYGLLLGRGRPVQVQERDRVGLLVKFISVKPTFTAVTSKMELCSLHKVEASLRLRVLLEALGVAEAPLNLLPPPQRLPVAATFFWLQRAHPPPDQRTLKVLLLALSNGDTLRHTAAQDWPFKQKLDVCVAHCFNQWQCCMKNSIHLNQLLSFPLPEPRISQLFEGTLVHELVHRSRWAAGRPKNFEKSGVKLYLSMNAVIQQLHSTNPPLNQPPVDELNVGMQQLVLRNDEDEEEEEEKEEEEEEEEELVSVRTRHRTKDRKKSVGKMR